jgi:hypothetical protein
MVSASTPADPPLPRWLYPALGAAIVALYWAPRLFRGFWVDETGTFWIVHKGFRQVWAQMQIYPGQSIVYTHLSSLFAGDGPHKEFWLRLPSVAGALVAAWLLYKLTEEIVGPQSGYLAAVLFCCAGAIVQTATYARPYAIGLAVIMASFWSLRRWVHDGRTGPLIVYCLCSPLVVYFHYLFGIVFAVQFIYLIAAWRAGHRFSWWKIAGAAGLIAVGALPLIKQVLTIAHQADVWKSSPPTFGAFFSFFPLQTLIVAFVGLALFRVFYPQWFPNLRGLAADDLVLLIAWLLLGPVVVFTGVRMTGYALFSTRYMIYALLPAFILVAWAIRQAGNQRARFALVAGVAVNAALYLPALRESEWRTPLETVRQMQNTPVLLRSGFVESGNMDLTGEPKPSSYLFAPLTAYPVANEIIPVPFFMNPEAERTIERRASEHGRFCLMATTGSDALESLPAWFTRHGYKASAREVSGFTIVLFER